MLTKKLLPVILIIQNLTLFAQGGWKFDTNPLNGTTSYTTIYSYIGCSFVELNGDKFVDLLLSPNTVFLNNGDGTFTQTKLLPYIVLNSTSGNSCADLDNDGDNDIIVSGVPSKVFFNNGLAIFSDSTSKIPNFGLYGSWGTAIGNFNNDRELDFFFAHGNGYLQPAQSKPCKFYKQTKNIFNPLSLLLAPVTDSLNTYTDPYWSDYDLDGDMDLFVATGPVMGIPDYDFCYKNLKIETGLDSLIPMTTELFATQKQDGQCYNFIDYDNDGDMDLCLTNYFSAATRMYKNTGGIYTSINTPFTVATTNIANCWGDYDNDGDLDVIITNDNQVSKYYRNNSGLNFTYLPGGFTTPTAVNGITNADYDNDGDLDLFTNGIGNNGNTISVGLYKNDTVAGNRNSINIKLKGTTSNASAIGATVRLKAIINNVPVWQLREVNAQNTFQGQNDLRVHFGLKYATTVDSLIVKWPSGLVENYVNFDVNSFYEITEGIGAVNTTVKQNDILRNDISVFPNPTSDIIRIHFSYSNSNLNYQLINIQGKELFEGKLNNNNSEIHMQALESGIYFLKIYEGDKFSTRKVIKN